MIIDSPIISGSYLSTGSLSQTGNVSITGSLTATAGISGSFSGSGADLFGIPASGITGLNLSQISSGSVSASISPNQGLLINTRVSASNFTGSFTGSLTGIATSASYASFALTSSYSLGGSGFPFSGSAVITGSLLVSGSAQITGSLSVSGSISASLFGTASQAASASYALTASYLLGYISPFPFTGSAAITGSLIVTGSVSISTLVTSSGVRYVIADQNGLISAQTASAAIFTTQQNIASAGQTVFPITNGYVTDYLTVFVNGTKLANDEFTDNDGVNVTFLTGSTAGDTVEFVKYMPASGVSNNTLRTVNYFTASLGQTNFTVNYTPGLLDVFYNGAKLDNTEYTAANGTSILLATGSNAGDTLEVDVYSYQVGAFSGIGGVGVANQIAYYNTTNSITGSRNFTVSGSAIIITGSLIVSGSGTFTNIGPAVFSGSVTAVGGFSGSFSGNADSASLAQNSLLLQGTGSIGFATTASLLAVSSSQQQISASLLNVVANYATTGSNSFRANQSITGSLVVSSTITAQTLVVQTVTSSIVYSSGSNIFGNAIGNTQTFTGSVNITGSNHTIFGNVGIGTNPSFPLHIYSLNQNVASNLATAYSNAKFRLETYNTSGQGISMGSIGGYSQYIQAQYSDCNTMNPLLLQPFSGSVGIGMSTAPTVALHVYSTGSSSSNITAEFWNGDYTTGARNFIKLRNAATVGSTTSAYFGQGQDQKTYFYNNDFSRPGDIVITNSGKVGINRSDSNYNLDISDNTGGTLNISHRNSSATVNKCSTLIFSGYDTICGEKLSGAIVGESINANYNGGNLKFLISTGNIYTVCQLTEAMRITSGGSVGIAATNPRTQLDIGDIHDGIGGTTFCSFLVAQGVWATFACITDNDANVITDITYVNNNDSNRSGALLARWAYNGTCVGTYIVNCGWNWSQNINQFGIRNNAGALQICLGGGANGYRVQARVQGARATG